MLIIITVALQPTPHQSLRDSFPSRGSLGLCSFSAFPSRGRGTTIVVDEVLKDIDKPEFIDILIKTKNHLQKLIAFASDLCLYLQLNGRSIKSTSSLFSGISPNEETLLIPCALKAS